MWSGALSVFGMWPPSLMESAVSSCRWPLLTNIIKQNDRVAILQPTLHPSESCAMAFVDGRDAHVTMLILDSL